MSEYEKYVKNVFSDAHIRYPNIGNTCHVVSLDSPLVKAFSCASWRGPDGDTVDDAWRKAAEKLGFCEDK